MNNYIKIMFFTLFSLYVTAMEQRCTLAPSPCSQLYKSFVPVYLNDEEKNQSIAYYLNSRAAESSLFVKKAIAFNTATQQPRTEINLKSKDFEAKIVKNIVYLLNTYAQSDNTSTTLYNKLLETLRRTPRKQLIAEARLVAYLEVPSIFNLLMKIIKEKINDEQLDQIECEELEKLKVAYPLLSNLKKKHDVLRQPHGITSLALSSDNTKMVIGLFGNNALVFDVPAYQIVGELHGHTSWISSVAFSPDGNKIITGSFDKTARLWDAHTYQQIGEPLTGHKGALLAAAFSPDGNHVVTSSFDRNTFIWNVGTQQKVGELPRHTRAISSVIFSPDGTIIITGCENGTAYIWDAHTYQKIGELQGHNAVIRSVAISHDGTKIATGSSDNMVRIWDTTRYQQIGEPLHGHTAWVNSVTFSPDGTKIITGSGDHSARLWDVHTHQQIGAPLFGHTKEITAAAFSPDGAAIVTVSHDKTIHVWPMPEPEIDPL